MPTSKSNRIDINDLAIWVKTFSWQENKNRTDADMKFTIEQMDDGALTPKECELFLNTTGNDMEKLCELLASRFAEVYQIEHLKYTLANDGDTIFFDVECTVHLAE